MSVTLNSGGKKSENIKKDLIDKYNDIVDTVLVLQAMDEDDKGEDWSKLKNSLMKNA